MWAEQRGFERVGSHRDTSLRVPIEPISLRSECPGSQICTENPSGHQREYYLGEKLRNLILQGDSSIFSYRLEDKSVYKPN